MVKIETLELEIRDQSTAAAQGIDRLTESLKKLKRATGMENIAKITHNIVSLNAALNTLDMSSVSNLNKLADAMERVGKSSEAFKNMRRLKLTITPGANQQNVTEGLTKTYFDSSKVASAMGGMSSPSFARGIALAELKTQLQGAGTAMDKFMGSLSKGLEHAGNFATAVGKAGLAVGKFSANLFKIAWTPFVNGIKKVTSGIGQLFSSIKRIALYRLIRSAIKAITTAFTEGVTAVYNYDKALGGAFSTTMDNLTSQMELLKGSLGSMAAPLIELVAPAIQTVTNIVIGLANALNQLFSIIGGKSGWTKATSAAKEYGDAVSGAAAAQSKLTAGIDELNVLSESSGSGGSSSDTGTIQFETVDYEGWAKNIKDLIDAGDWQGVGTALAEKFNSLIENWDADAWGTKLGEKIQHGIELSYGFLKNLDTETLGNKIATALNSMLDAIDFDMAGRTLAEKWNRIVDLINGFAEDFEFKDFGTKMATFVNGMVDAFNASKLAETISNVLSGALEAISGFFSKLDANTLTQKIRDFFGGIKWGELGTATGHAFSSVLGFGLDLASAFLDSLNGQPVGETIFDYFENAIKAVDWEMLWLKVEKLFIQVMQKNPLTALGDMIESISKDVFGVSVKVFPEVQTYFDQQLDMVNRKIEDHATGADAILDSHGMISENTVREHLGGVSSAFDESGKLITGTATELESQISSVFGGITSNAETSMKEVEMICETHSMLSKDAVAEHLGVAAEIAGEKIAEIKQVTTTSWSDIANTTVSDWHEIQNTVSTVWAKLDGLAKERFASIEKYVTTAWLNIEKDTTLKWGEAGTITTTLTTALNNTLLKFKEVFMDEGNVQTMVTNAFTAMETAIATSTANAYNSIDTFVTKSIERFEELIREIERYNEAEASAGAGAEIELTSYHYSPNTYANGGVVSSGELFVARENGNPELVGSFGSSTGVMNNDQIVEAVAGGVYDAVVSAMAQSGNKSNAVYVYLDGKQIEASTRTTKQRRGATIANGGVVNYA